MRRTVAQLIVLVALSGVLGSCGGGANQRAESARPAQATVGPSVTAAMSATAPPAPTSLGATAIANRASAEAAQPTLTAVSATSARPVASATLPRSATIDPNTLPIPALYPIPATCAIATRSGLERRRTYPAYWLDGDGLAAGGAPHLFEGGQKIQWQAEPGGKNTLVLAGARLDGPAPAPPQIVSQYNIGVGTWSSTTNFPAPGCWRIEATDGVHTLAAIVYVYPRACTPPAIRDPREQITSDCAPPAP